MKSMEKKRIREQQIVEEMIRIYCKGKGHVRDEGAQLCPACRELHTYARMRSEKCPFMEQKTFCSQCPVHCYRADMREQIRAVMRYAGPRMLWHHPVLAIWHIVCTIREKRKASGKKGAGRI